MSKIRKIDLMHQLFGKNEQFTCGECRNLVSIVYRGSTYRKCKVYGESCCEATDWAKRWTACGNYNFDYQGVPVIEAIKQRKVGFSIEPMEGQLTL